MAEWEEVLDRGTLRARARGEGAKRALDVAVSAVLVAAALPLAAVIATAIRAESRGPVLFRCRRVGEGAREFDMLKFRKMAPGTGGAPLTVAGDPRFTRGGAALARTKLDELPQLLNVLRGEMSLVGPRPEDPAIVELERARFDGVLEQRPGITGLSQLAYRREAELLDPRDPLGDYRRRVLPAKLQLDRLYVEHRSLALDLRILAWTGAALVLRRDVAVDRRSARLSVRRRGRAQRPVGG